MILLDNLSKFSGVLLYKIFRDGKYGNLGINFYVHYTKNSNQSEKLTKLHIDGKYHRCLVQQNYSAQVSCR